MCRDKTTRKLSLTSSKVCVLPPLTSVLEVLWIRTTLRAPPPPSWTVAPLRTTAPVWQNYYGVFQLREELVTVCVAVVASSKWNLCLILFLITRSHALKNKQVLFYIPEDCHGAQMCILAIDLIMLFHAVLVYSSFECLVDHNPSSLCLLLWWILI